MAKGKAAEIIGLGAAATAVGGAYKFAEFLVKAKRIRDVGPANAVYVRLINRVRADLDEVKRLLTVPEVKDALAANVPKAKWVYGTMRDVRGALEVITPLTERVGGDVEDGRRVGIRHRLRWLLSESEKLQNREKELLVAHSSLNEAIGYLTALEPTEPSEKGAYRDERDTRVDIDIDVRHEPHDRRVEEREVWIERDRDPRRVEVREEEWIEEKRGPRRVEEREVHFEREPGRRVEERETWVEHERERDPRRVEVQEEWVERGRDPRHAHRYEEHVYDTRHGEERDLRLERDGRHVEATYTERGPGHYDEKHYEERFDRPRRSGVIEEDRVPERDTWMQSAYERPRSYAPAYGSGRYGEYAEYGAPQPIGPAQYRSREVGDPGFGDELVTNPQPVPPMPYNRSYEREEWIEEKQDFNRDQYGNRLPPPIQGTRYPRHRL